MKQHADAARRPWRATLVALLLGVLCVGDALLPGRSLLPQPWETVAAPALEIREEGGELQLPQLQLPTRAAYLPHRKDKLLQFYPFDTWVGDSWRQGHVPLWTPRSLCGLPLLAQGTSRAFYPSAAIFAFVEPSVAYAWLWLLHLTLAGLFAYRLARRLGASEGGGLLALGSLVLSGYASGHVQHPMIFAAAIWTLPALEAVHALLRPSAAKPKRMLSCAALAACVAASWFAGFAQASVLLSYSVVLFSLTLGWLLWRERGSLPWRDLLWPAGGLLLGTLLAMVQILPMLEMASLASRQPASLDELRQASLPIAGLLELILPGQLCIPGEVLVGSETLSARPSFLSLALLSTEEAKLLASGASNINHTEIALGMGFWPLLFALFSLRRLFGRGSSLELRSIIAFGWCLSLVGLLGSLALPGLVHALHALPGFAVGDLKRLLMLPALALPILAGLGWRRPCKKLLPRAMKLGSIVSLLGLFLLTLNDSGFAQLFGMWIAPRFGLEPQAFLAALLPPEAQINHDWLASGVLLGGLAICLGPVCARQLRLGALGFVAATLLTQLPIAWDATPAPRQAELRALARERWDPKEDAPTIEGRILSIELPAPGEAMRSPGDQRLGTPYLGPYAAATGYAPLAPARIERYFRRFAPEAVGQGGAGLGPLRRWPTTEQLPYLAAAGIVAATSNILPPSGIDSLRVAPEALRSQAWQALRSRADSAGRLPPGNAAPVRLEHAPFVRWLPQRPPATCPDNFAGLPKSPAATISSPVSVAKWNGQQPLRLRVQSQQAGWIYAAFTHLPGFEYRLLAPKAQWKPTLVALDAFQCFPVPAGEHEIDLRYRPASFVRGAALSGFAVLALLALLLTPLLRPLLGTLHARRAPTP
ncbi:MAG: hypothetical protein CSA62_06915 [Planctomycetota bacterium]|nr:MAG: hypothetical protein CSA62_06915 [Planctomycetota bacterium]